jgi:uncharacterized membrane protein
MVGRWTSILVISTLLLSFPFLPAGLWGSEWLELIGRIHPIAVHFPVAIVILAAFFEWWFGKRQRSGSLKATDILVQLALFSSVVSVIAGYLLYRTGGYEGDTIYRHLWTGCLLTVLLFWADGFRRDYRQHRRWRSRQWYRSLLFLSVPLLLYVGHLGGSVTHGADFLSEPYERWQARNQLEQTTAMRSPASLKVFEDMIMPALEEKCMSCHNKEKTKGGLNLIDYEHLQAGGDSGDPILIAGQPEASELYKRITLPKQDDEYMPPDGKPALDSAVVQLIGWWIGNGATVTDTLGNGPADPQLKKAIDAYLPQLAVQQQLAEAARLERLKIGPKLIRLCYDLGLEVRPDPDSDDARYILSMRIPAQTVTDETIAQLMPYKDVFSRISLASADITDAALFHLGQMSHLRDLILIKTCIDGSGLAYLQDLPELRMLNLSHTDVDNTHVLGLTAFDQLETVYLFNAKVDDNVMKALQDHLSDTDVSIREGPYY